MKIKFMSIIVCLTLVLTALTIVPSITNAATEGEINDSIESGLSWLADQQNTDGSWTSYYAIAYTGLAVLKFIDYVKEVPEIDSWTDLDYVYHDVVVDGLDYLFSNGYYVDITVQTYGDPDILDNDKGITFNGFDDYECSIALMAIASTMTPTEVVNSAGPLNGLTYADVVQDVVDYLSYTQRESTYARGGWGYEGDADWADNSVSGYASLGLGYAEIFGATIPQFVIDELEHWIGIIQSPTGYSYYRPPAVWSDPYGDSLYRTGNLLYEMALVGMPLSDPQVQLALSYIENNWALGGNSYQRAFAMMKGLAAYGIEDEIDVGTSGDWFEEISTYIVSTQNTDGSWPADPHDYDYPYAITTAWALLTLEKAVAIPIPSEVEVTKDFRYTSVDFTPYHWEDPDGIPDSGDEYMVQDPAILGDLLPMDGDNYLVKVVMKNKKNTVSSTNPGQLYGVISITGPVSKVYIEDYFDQEFNINPQHYHGGIEVIIVDPDGYATVITGYPGLSGDVWNDDPFNDALISINLTKAIGGPLQSGHTLMIYVKFQTAMKHQNFPGGSFDFEFWNRPKVWINDDVEPIELEEIIELSIK